MGHSILARAGARSARTLLLAALILLSGFAALARADDVKVFAAASLKDALEDVARLRQGMPNAPKVVYSFAASSALAKQIENGAPADIFISADEDWMNYVAQKQLVDAATRIDLLGNRLVLIAPVDSTVQAVIAPGFPLASLLGGRRLAVADPDYVPAGKYAKAALESMKVWHDLQGKLARAENVRAALALVSRGEAPLGIVYATDARADPKVRVVGEFPAGSYPRIVYPAAVMAASTNPRARGFLAFLASPQAWEVFARHGFLPAR